MIELKKILIVFNFLFFSIIFSYVLEYDVFTDGATSTMIWNIEKLNERVVYESKLDEISQKYIYFDDILQEWIYEDSLKSKKIVAVRKGDYVDLKIFEKDVLIKTVTLNLPKNAMWFQNPDFFLIKYFKEYDDNFKFFLINPDDLKINIFNVEYLGEEELDIHGKSFLTDKFKASVNIFLGISFNTYYWYRSSDSRFLKFKTEAFLLFSESLTTVSKEYIY